MSLPRIFKNSHVSKLHQFIKQYSFATVISQGPHLRATHIPLLLFSDQGKFGTLVGHMGKHNDQWKDFDGKRSVLCIFQGPHAYISPTWYKKGPEVPTWNYAMVHASGVPLIIHDKSELLKELNSLINTFEPALLNQTSEAYIPEDYKKSQLDFIVGFRIEIEEIIGKYKLGQTRSLEDQEGVYAGLSNHTKDADAIALARFMDEHDLLPEKLKSTA